MDIQKSFNETAAECSKAFSIPIDNLMECANSGLGNNLLYLAGNKTNNSLNPKLNYIPWLVLDNKHDDYIQKAGEFSLLALLCNEYQVSCFFIVLF